MIKRKAVTQPDLGLFYYFVSPPLKLTKEGEPTLSEARSARLTVFNKLAKGGDAKAPASSPPLKLAAYSAYGSALFELSQISYFSYCLKSYASSFLQSLLLDAAFDLEFFKTDF